MTYESKPCRFCQDEFVPLRSNQDFCSIKCRDAWWARHWKTEPHKCPQCGIYHNPSGVISVVDPPYEVTIVTQPKL